MALDLQRLFQWGKTPKLPHDLGDQPFGHPADGDHLDAELDRLYANDTELDTRTTDLAESKLARNGSQAMTGNLNMAGYRIQTLPIPVAGSDAARKQELDSVQSALNSHKTGSDHDGRYYTESEINTLLASVGNVATESMTWHTPTFINGWTGYAYYAKDRNGIVYITFWNLNAEAATAQGAFQLPAGYRSNRFIYTPVTDSVNENRTLDVYTGSHGEFRSSSYGLIRSARGFMIYRAES